MIDQRQSAGTSLTALSGLWLVASGLSAWFFAARRELLPHDSQFLGMSGGVLCAVDSCRVFLFMVHDRASFGGAVIAVGILYAWLARGPLARGEAWAFWTLLASGTAGFLSFLAYLQFGYLDLFHLWATLVTFALYALGMVLAWQLVRDHHLHRSVVLPIRGVGRLSAGRLLLALTALGFIGAGLTILALGSTVVFVPTDLVFMKLRAEELAALSPHLVPLIAHDRAGFGGALCSAGIALLPTVVCGTKRGARGLWWVLLGCGLAGFGAAIGVHFLVGYLSLLHLLPAVVGALIFVTGILLLRGPMCAVDAHRGQRTDV